MTAEEEKRMYEGFGYPVIDIGGAFEGSFSFDKENKKVVENEDGHPVSILHNSNKISVNEQFKAEIRVGLDKLDLKANEHLTTKTSLAEATCLLFETKVLERIEKAVEEIKDKQTCFESGYPKEVSI